MKYGLPFWVSPWTPVVTLSNPSGTTGITIGVYFAVAGVPFVSTRFTVTPLAVPVNWFSGTNVTVPSSATVYTPSPGTSFLVVPSSNVAGTLASIGNSVSPAVNVTVPVWVLPWNPVVVLSCPSGTTGVTVGV